MLFRRMTDDDDAGILALQEESADNLSLEASDGFLQRGSRDQLA
jgi:hypothetical protein